jgi:hypothetical protein
MDVILHIGAHRCATTSFQHYLRANGARLAEQGIGYWGPLRTRGGLLGGVMNNPCARGGRLRRNLSRRDALGFQMLLVSDENMLGYLRDNRLAAELYPGAGDRIARHAAAFGDRLRMVVLNLRALDGYWTSALGFGVMRGWGLPGRAVLDRLAGGARGWREVVTEIAHAAPQARLLVLPFEDFAGRPGAQLTAISGLPSPRDFARQRLNATPGLDRLRQMLPPGQAARLPSGDGRWTPFSVPQVALLRQRHADDMGWLTAGADGFARLIDGTDTKIAGLNPRRHMTEGRRDDHQRQMAGAG